MFSLSSRRYTGAKTKLLSNIDSALLESFNYAKSKNLSFFDVFGGTGVVSEYFMQKPQFAHFIINDFLESNFSVYQGFFSQSAFDFKKLESLKQEFNNLKPRENYYCIFGDKFFSKRDSSIIGEIRERLDKLLKSKSINEKEFYILLASLLYSADRIANTVGHYDAYRKNVLLSDKFDFKLIKPIKPLNTGAAIEICKKDSNILSKDFAAQKRQIDIAFIDPPYNSRQYSRFYHLLETIAQNTKPKLYGVALKPQPQNLSAYCKIEAKEAFSDLIEHLSKIARILIVTYNNTWLKTT